MSLLSSRKLTFALINAVLFMLIASPAVYRIVGSLVGLEYDGENSSKYTLLFIHSIVFMVVTLISLNLYNPVA